ncbi:MAG TPA: 2-oxo-tetronate isomerase [Casimicrobiaceae bacterium]|nr:2-oxo-tetronate isomerase [Casimicrobiaceae bacterium]
MPRFSANLSFLFTELPFLDRFAAAATAGFRAVEFAFAYETPPREIAARVEDNGLALVLINTPPGNYAAGERGFAALPGREREFGASLATALSYARELSCPRIHVMAGALPETADLQERALARATYLHNLRVAAREAEGEGIELTIEPINPRDIPGYFLNTQTEAHAIREEVGAANLKVQMDFYHAQIVEGDLSEKVKRWLPHIGHIQIAGVPGRHEPDTGEIHYPHLFALLDELGYSGWVGCEYKPRNGTLAGLGWMKRFATV